METPEVPLEHAHETIEHHAHQATEKWIMGVALTAAILAVLAAITALMAEHHVNEAMIQQIRSSDKWGQYQADSIKAKIIETKLSLLSGLGKPVDPADSDKLAKYDREKAKLDEDARQMEEDSERHLKRHEPLARGITMFQVAIAIGAISVLTRRKVFWYMAIAFGALGLVFLTQGVL
jgi:hypothetical protein